MLQRPPHNGSSLAETSLPGRPYDPAAIATALGKAVRELNALDHGRHAEPRPITIEFMGRQYDAQLPPGRGNSSEQVRALGDLFGRMHRFSVTTELSPNGSTAVCGVISWVTAPFRGGNIVKLTYEGIGLNLLEARVLALRALEKGGRVGITEFRSTEGGRRAIEILGPGSAESTELSLSEYASVLAQRGFKQTRDVTFTAGGRTATIGIPNQEDVTPFRILGSLLRESDTVSVRADTIRRTRVSAVGFEYEHAVLKDSNSEVRFERGHGGFLPVRAVRFLSADDAARLGRKSEPLGLLSIDCQSGAIAPMLPLSDIARLAAEGVIDGARPLTGAWTLKLDDAPAFPVTHRAHPGSPYLELATRHLYGANVVKLTGTSAPSGGISIFSLPEASGLGGSRQLEVTYVRAKGQDFRISEIRTLSDRHARPDGRMKAEEITSIDANGIRTKSTELSIPQLIETMGRLGVREKRGREVALEIDGSTHRFITCVGGDPYYRLLGDLVRGGNFTVTTILENPLIVSVLGYDVCITAGAARSGDTVSIVMSNGRHARVSIRKSPGDRVGYEFSATAQRSGHS